MSEETSLTTLARAYSAWNDLMHAVAVLQSGDYAADYMLDIMAGQMQPLGPWLQFQMQQQTKGEQGE